MYFKSFSVKGSFLLGSNHLIMELWKKFKDLFKQAEESSPTKPLIHEMIKRSGEEKEDYEFWKNTLVCRRLNDWLSNQYAMYQALPNDTDEAIDFLDTPSSKGFVIHFYKTQYSIRDVTHLLDYYKEQVLKLDYRTQISDRREFIRNNRAEKIERHYLKPKPEFLRSEKFNQRFGNVMIELSFRDDMPYRLKFSATIYKDALFKDAEDFRDLMQMILA